MFCASTSRIVTPKSPRERPMGSTHGPNGPIQKCRILQPGHSNCCLACASCARAMDASARGWGRMGRPRHGTRLSEQARLKKPNTRRHWTWLESGSCSPANNRPSMRLFKCLLRVHSPQRYSVHSTQVAHHNNEGKRGKWGKGKPGKRPTSPKEDLLTAACCLATPAPAASPASSAPLEPPEPCFRPAHSAQGPPLVC